MDELAVPHGSKAELAIKGVTQRLPEIIESYLSYHWAVAVSTDDTVKVIKKDGVREPFERDKIHRGLAKACWKRPG